MDWKNDEALKALIEKGKQTGSLTYDEVNQALPETSEPDRLPDLLELLEQQGITLIEAEDAEEEGEAAVSEDALLAEVEAAFEDSDGDGRHIDDPVRMYLTQMGEIPLLSREKELTLAKQIEVYRKRFRYLLVSNHEMMQRGVKVLEQFADSRDVGTRRGIGRVALHSQTSQRTSDREDITPIDSPWWHAPPCAARPSARPRPTAAASPPAAHAPRP